MNTNQLKKFACEARNILKKGIRAKIQTLGFNDNGVVPEHLMPQKLQGGTIWNGGQYPEGYYDQWMAIYHHVAEKGIQEVYEEAAYTWFNRLMAIRILQKNGFCEPVLVYTNEARTPRIVDEARMGRLPQMKEDARRNLMDLLEDDTKVTEQFAILITAWCHNNPIIQACFGGMDDFTELLLPINILAEGGFVDMINHTEFITDEDFHSPELIGWLYQFYISERKDEVFAKKGKFEADEIPAATQIFTPNWIVKYMVQNTVGRIYLDNNPGTTAFNEKWKYLVEQEPATDDVIYHYDELIDLKVADLASGSGHILNECFDLLYDLYVYEGYSRSEAVENIFTKNLTGIDLDNRAKQLSMFALMVKACQKDANFVDAHCLPHVLTMPKALEERETETGKVIPSLDAHLRHFCQDEGTSQCYTELQAAFELMQNADSLGSIMKFDISKTTRLLIEQMVTYWEEQKYQDDAIVNELMPGMKLILALTTNYAALVMNPPYMGGSNMNEVLSKYVKDNYEDSKADLFSVFMDVVTDKLQASGKYGMINMQSWMFLSSFEKLRKKVLDNQHIDSMLHLGPRTFDELSGEVVQNTAFVISKNITADAKGVYYRLVDGKNCADKERMFLNHNENGAKIYYPAIPQANFEKIPGCPIIYWMSSLFISHFCSDKQLGSVADLRSGISTGDNNRFYRFWAECSKLKIQDSYQNTPFNSKFKWFKIIRGGTFRRWYGCCDNVINLENSCSEIANSGLNHRLRTAEFYNKQGITWNRISSGDLGFRVKMRDFNFGENSPCMFFDNTQNIQVILAILNSKCIATIINAINPTLSNQVADLLRLPICSIDKQSLIKISLLVEGCISISKLDWDSHETSWDFQTNELLAIDESTYMDNIHNSEEAHFQETGEHICFDPAAPQLDSLEWRVEQYKQKWEHKFMQLHANEEELNRQFIEIYGLQDELIPDVPLNEITILQQGEISIEREQRPSSLETMPSEEEIGRSQISIEKDDSK